MELLRTQRQLDELLPVQEEQLQVKVSTYHTNFIDITNS